MIKKLITFVCALTMVFSMGATALADDGYIDYVGGAEKFIFAPGSNYSPTDLFPNLKNVMPGDKLTQKIEIRNATSNKAKVNLYLRSKGSKRNTDELLRQLQLSVKLNGTSELYDAPANAPAQLTDWVFLGTIYSGGTIELDITLDVPITLGNEFQNAIGYIDWEFKAEEIPETKTGDETNLVLPLAIACTSTALIIILVAFRRKANKDEK